MLKNHVAIGEILYFRVNNNGFIMIELKLPLNNVQLELLRLYSTNLSDKDLEELKNVLARFYADKAILKANEIWDQKNLSDADMEIWLNEKS